mmetsp:Transcript_6725/g.15556  ORF Transcript_6725/g.15556 Transcript_6725/m.15556 type:complete len:210 (+) Transcript_6725:262-891(+)
MAPASFQLCVLTSGRRASSAQSSSSNHTQPSRASWHLTRDSERRRGCLSRRVPPPCSSTLLLEAEEAKRVEEDPAAARWQPLSCRACVLARDAPPHGQSVRPAASVRGRQRPPLATLGHAPLEGEEDSGEGRGDVGHHSKRGPLSSLSWLQVPILSHCFHPARAPCSHSPPQLSLAMHPGPEFRGRLCAAVRHVCGRGKQADDARAQAT